MHTHAPFSHVLRQHDDFLLILAIDVGQDLGLGHNACPDRRMGMMFRKPARMLDVERPGQARMHEVGGSALEYLEAWPGARESVTMPAISFCNWARGVKSGIVLS